MLVRRSNKLNDKKDAVVIDVWNRPDEGQIRLMVRGEYEFIKMKLRQIKTHFAVDFGEDEIPDATMRRVADTARMINYPAGVSINNRIIFVPTPKNNGQMVPVLMDKIRNTLSGFDVTFNQM
jgi:hypothetical protein